MKQRHVCVMFRDRDLRRAAGWRLKEAEKRAASWPEGDFTIALRGHDIAGIAAMRIEHGDPQCAGSPAGPCVSNPRQAASNRASKPRAALHAAPLLVALVVSGCAPVGPNFERPAAIVSPQFKEIKGWKVATPRANEPKGAWWSVFRDPELDRLMQVVVVSNQTIKADEANYRQALALINEARAGLFPSVNGVGSATRSSTTGTILTAEGSGSWTLDIWGQVRREIEAEQAGAQTNAAILANALLAAQSTLALAYVTLRQADSLEDLLGRTIEDYKRSVTITQNQYNAGTAAKSDVITAQAQLLNAQAALIAAGVTRAQSEHAIAVLVGRPPAGLTIRRGSLATRVPSIPVGLPSSLLERRPDVAAAEQTMRQANAQIGVEFAGYFPAVSLSSLIGYSGNPFATEFGPTNPVWSFGSSLAQPLFNGGLTTAQVEAARQTYQGDVASYRQTVLTAIQQVEDALAGIRILSREVKVQEEDVRISRQATQITLNEYKAGTQAFTAVVTAETQQLSAEESLLSTQGQLQADAVNLIVALGGGWSQSMLPDVTAETSAIPPH
jgi:NodT family efflux transporter outer membrane factor (OMF) lipoprotein